MNAALVAVVAVLVGVAAALIAALAKGKRLRRELAEAQARVETLAKYQAIVDAEAHAAGVIANAENRAASIVAEANGKAAAASIAAEAAASRLRVDSQHEAARVVALANEARVKAEADAEEMRRATRAKADAAAIGVEAARVEATHILDHARARAGQIGGEALEAKRDADKYAKTAEAMKNVIEGYGDKYLVPTFTVLDALGEEYGFAEAGQKLKAAREHTRWMVTEGRAASCDYVEDRRKSTAIDFVLDAFNGKVDTILAGVKRDNYGTLEQKVRDAFALVNINGEAFRKARINDDYLDARLQELRWAVAVQELREKDKEEQRELRERIREEEKARREYERAMKEAAKEEETLLKLRAKVQAEVDKASDEQRAKFENQLAEVNERLRVAEEKNQRALSMAQQTKAGHVYVISNEGSFGENVLKIGLTRRLEPLDRIRELGDASVPFEFDVHAMIRSDDAPTLERELHKRFVEASEAAVRAYNELLAGLESKFGEVPSATLRRKQARQAARAVLPNATETRIVVTGNYRAWRHFVTMRATETADVEIRELAVACLRELQRIAPNVFADFTISTLPDGSEVASSPYSWES